MNSSARKIEQLLVENEALKARIKELENKDNNPQRTQTQAALQKSEILLKEAQKLAHIGSWELDVASNRLEWSQETYRIFGIEPGSAPLDLEGALEVVHPEDREELKKQIESYLPFRSDYRIQLPGGIEKTIHEEVKIEYDASGNPLRIMGTAQDISEQVRAERALFTSKEKLRIALEGAVADNWEMDLRQGTLTFSQQWGKRLGYEPDEIPQTMEAIQGLIHPDDLQRTFVDLNAYLDGNTAMYETECRLRKKNGEYVWLLSRGKQVETDAMGKPVRLVGTNFDITERRKAELALRKSEKELQIIFNSAIDGIVLVDLQGNLLRANAASLEMFRFDDQAEVIGKHLFDYILESDHQRALDNLNKARMEKPTPNDEYTAVREDGSTFPIIASSGVITDENGQPTGFVTVLKDIHDRKELEAAMLYSQKMADLGTLSAGVAHEINSPLQVITGISESVLNSLERGSFDGDRLPHNLETINRNAWRIANIVRSLLAFARSTPGETEPQDLNEIIQDTLLLIEHRLHSWSNIEVVLTLDKDLPVFHCERNNIAQMIINLVNNAADAMSSGGEIKITTKQLPKQGQIQLQVQDSGSGIPPDVLPRIFDPFFTTKEIGKGTGLGLSIVMGIVNTHGGTMDVSSQPGFGTTFTLNFPTRPLKMNEKEPEWREQSP